MKSIWYNWKHTWMNWKLYKTKMVLISTENLTNSVVFGQTRSKIWLLVCWFGNSSLPFLLIDWIFANLATWHQSWRVKILFQQKELQENHSVVSLFPPGPLCKEARRSITTTNRASIIVSAPELSVLLDFLELFPGIWFSNPFLSFVWLKKLNKNLFVVQNLVHLWCSLSCKRKKQTVLQPSVPTDKRGYPIGGLNFGSWHSISTTPRSALSVNLGEGNQENTNSLQSSVTTESCENITSFFWICCTSWWNEVSFFRFEISYGWFVFLQIKANFNSNSGRS